MSKIRLHLNKESLVILSTALAVGVLVLINLFILIPALTKIFSSQPKQTNDQLIDTQTVDQAVKLLTP